MAAQNGSGETLGETAPPVRTEEEKSLIEALARQAVAEVAPQELPLFRSTSRAYLDDPKRLRGEPASADDMLGFGAELGVAVSVVTPIVLEVARSVVVFVAGQLEGAVKEEAAPRIRELVRRLVGSAGAPEPADRPDQEAAAAPEPSETVLTRSQLVEVREVAIRTAERLKLAPDRAATLADAIVGSLAI